MKEKSMNEDLISLKWVRLFAGACGLLAAAGIALLVATESYGADHEPGMQPGAKPFNNPFLNNPGDEEDFEVDDEELEDPGLAPGFRPGNNKPGNGRGGITLGNPPPGNDVPDPQRGAGGISIGGGPPSGVIPNNKTAALDVETDTGRGSNEVITDFNYPDADIMDLAKTMGKLTGKNFIVDKDVKGKVTIISNGPITVGDAWRAFLTALDMNTFTIIPSGRFLRIARQRDARDKQINTYTGSYSPNTDTLITRVFPLKHIGAEEIARTFRSFMPTSSRIIPHQQTNTVIVTDTGANVSKLARMLDFLDVEGFDAGIEVVSVKYASAVEISKLIDKLLPGTEANTGRGGRPAISSRGGSAFTARRTKEGGIVNTIIADERTNNLIVHANNKGVEQVKELLAKLDKRVPSRVADGKIRVIYLQFADAEKIAETLNKLTQSSGGSKPAGGAGTVGGIGINPTVTEIFEGSIKVSPDKATNSLVVTASPTDFDTLKHVIKRLDIPRDEVYVEIVIMETSVGRQFDYSANVVLPSGNARGGLITNPEDVTALLSGSVSSKGMILPFASGESKTISVAGQQVTVNSVMGLIKMIQTHSNGSVLATPQILTLDNEEATFQSNEKIPIASTTTTATGLASANITKEPIGITIKIKPQINKISNFVKLEIDAKLEDIVKRDLPAAVSNQAFATIERTAKTHVTVADGDTVVLGGLIRDKVSEITSKVPVLGDIPLLGWLFKSRSSAKEKANLLIFITPAIIRQYEKVRAILDKKLKERDDFLEKNAGGTDNSREYRDDMIRSLPDIKDILSYKAATDPDSMDEPQAPAPIPAPAPAPGGTP